MRGVVWIAFFLCIHHVTGRQVKSDQVTIKPQTLNIVPSNDNAPYFQCEGSLQNYIWAVNGSTNKSDEMKQRGDIDITGAILFVKRCFNNTHYGCGYNDTNGFVLNVNGTVYCRGFPSVTIALSKDKNGTTFKATVDGVGKDKFTYKWKHDDEEIIGETANNLSIANPTDESNEGKYVCAIRNEYGDEAVSNAVRFTNVHVTIKPQTLYIGPSNGNPLYFECKGLHRYIWAVNGSTDKSDEMEQRSEIDISGDKLFVKRCFNNTQYGCGYNDITNGFVLNVSGTVYCRGFPSVTVALSKDKNGATFKATADGVGKFTYKWKHNDQEIKEETSTLIISNPTKVNEGDYVCVVSNEYGDEAESKPVTFTISPQVQDMDPVEMVLEGNATLTCNATGKNISYKWKIGSGSFPTKVTGINTTTLVIPDVRSSDDNTYICVASNEGGSNSSDVKLSITGLPSVTVAPSKDDNGVTFTATVDGVGKDKFTYKWKYNDEDINGETAHTLIITNPKESDEGEYVCVVSNEYKDEAKSKPVTLAIPPQIQDMNPVTVDLEGNATLTCKATGENISYKWTIGSGSFPTNVTGVNTTTLVILNVSSSADNTYTCEASNEGGSDSSDVKLTITGLPSVTVAPSKDENGATIFKATVDGVGKDKFTYKWKHNDEEIEGETANTLIFTNPDESDEGEYVCAVSNEYGDKAESAPVTLTMTVPPQVQDMNPVTVVLEGDATLTCKATGDNISYKWTIGSGVFPTKVTDINTKVLVIPDLRSSDENIYTCVASNEGGKDSSEVKLSITGLPSVNVALSKDKNGVTFTATVDGVGKDRFTFKWKHNDKDIDGKTANTLIITNPDESDEGKYVCVVSNEYEDEAESAPVSLTVKNDDHIENSDENDNQNGGFIGSNFFFLMIIIVIIVVPTVYVCHQNREKISKLCGERGRYRPYKLLPTSVGEALTRHND